MPTPHQIATEFEIETELLLIKSLGKDFIKCKYTANKDEGSSFKIQPVWSVTHM